MMNAPPCKLVPFHDFCDFLHSSPTDTIALDCETTVVDLNKELPYIVIVSASNGFETYVCWLRSYDVAGRALGAAIRKSGKSFVFHNAAFDLSVFEYNRILHRANILDLAYGGRFHDTLILDQLLRLMTGGEGPGRPGEAYYHKSYDGTLPRRSLKDLAKEYVGIELEKGAVRTSYGEIHDPARLTREQVDYAGRDAWATYWVYDKMTMRLPPAECGPCRPWGLWGPLSEAIQITGSIALWDIGRRGLAVDRDRLLERQKVEREKVYEAGMVLDGAGLLEAKIGPRSRKASVKLNEKKLRQYLLNWAMANDHQKVRFTKGGKVSLSKRDWDQFRGEDEVIDAYITYKAGEKADRTFIRRWLEYSADDGIIRARYRPLVASGRVSCYRPNLQQVPKRKGSMREMFMARPGAMLYELDYSTLELCCLSQCCIDLFGKSRMGELINEGRDLHRYIAALIYGKPEEEITKEERFLAKMVNFGFGGGMGAKTFKQHAWTLARLELTEAHCRKLKGVWLEAYPEMHQWLLKVPHRNLTQDLGVPGLSDWNMQTILRGWSYKTDLTSDQIGKVFEYLLRDPRKFRLTPEYPRSARLINDIMQGKGSPALLDWVEWRTSLTRTGRQRCPVSYTEYLNTQFQGLAADGAKLAAAMLWAHQYNICAFVHDAFLIEIGPAPVERVERARQIMIDQMQRVVPDIKISVEVGGPYKHWGEDLV
jgi:hypothetical protein